MRVYAFLRRPWQDPGATGVACEFSGLSESVPLRVWPRSPSPQSRRVSGFLVTTEMVTVGSHSSEDYRRGRLHLPGLLSLLALKSWGAHG